MTSPVPARSPRRRAPRNSLNRDLILDSALRLLDGKGTDAFTMRALASELNVGAMALYTYFRGKDELFDAARDRLLARYQPPREEGSPREQLREACLAVYRLFAEHPCVLDLLVGARDRCAAVSVGVDHMLELLGRSGLGRAEAARAHTALMQYTLGVALWAERTHERVNAERRQEQPCAPAGVDSGLAQEIPREIPQDVPAAAGAGAMVSPRHPLECERDPGARTEVPGPGVHGSYGTPASFEYGLDALLEGLLGHAASVSGAPGAGRGGDHSPVPAGAPEPVGDHGGEHLSAP